MRDALLLVAAISIAALLVLLGWWARGVVEAYNEWLHTPIVVEGEPLPPLDNPCPTGYWTIMPGDTIWSIARYCYPGQHTGRMVDEILRANQGLDPGRLKVGQRLVLPERGR